MFDIAEVARFMMSEVEHVGEEFDTMFRYLCGSSGVFYSLIVMYISGHI